MYMCERENTNESCRNENAKVIVWVVTRFGQSQEWIYEREFKSNGHNRENERREQIEI